MSLVETAFFSTPAFRVERVLNIRHWTPELFSFQTTRDPGFRFESGQFVMVGLKIGSKPILRAYSIASAFYDEHLEFFSIKVPDGPLTSHLKNLSPGDEVLVGRKTSGTLVLHNLTPGRNLYLLGTGTGLAPFLSLIRDPQTYERYERVILAHSCRRIADLAYADFLTHSLLKDELVGTALAAKFTYYPTVTREPFRNYGRLTELILGGSIFKMLDLPGLDPAKDRVMLCGNQAMLNEFRIILEQRHFREGNKNHSGSFVFERAFVD